MRATRHILIAMFALILAVVGTASAETTGDEEQTFFTRRTACENDLRLSVTAGSGEGGCGFTLTGTNEINGVLGDEQLTLTFPTADGTPAKLDVARSVQGQITVSNFGSTQGNSVGRAWIDVTLHGSGKRADGSNFNGTLGTAKGEDYLRAPGATPSRHTSTFEFELPAEVDGITFTSLIMDVIVNGTHVGHGAVINDGQSFVTLPIIPLEPAA